MFTGVGCVEPPEFSPSVRIAFMLSNRLPSQLSPLFGVRDSLCLALPLRLKLYAFGDRVGVFLPHDVALAAGALRDRLHYSGDTSKRPAAFWAGHRLEMATRSV